MPQTLIHIGYPKTGSTFLQRHVFPGLKDIHYLDPTPLGGDYARIAMQDEWNFDVGNTRESILAHFKPGSNLLSHEALVGDQYFFRMMNSRIIANRLKALFPEAKILVVIRNQYELMESIYKQYVHEGGILDFKRFIRFEKGQLQGFSPSWGPWVYADLFDFSPLVEYYEALYGHDRIHVIPYEFMDTRPTLFYAALSKFLGETVAPAETSVRPNWGYGARQIAMARLLNRFFRSNYNEGSLIPAIPIPRLGRLDSGVIRRLLQSETSRKWLGVKSMEQADVRGAVLHKFSESNRKLSKKFSLELDTLCPGKYF